MKVKLINYMSGPDFGFEAGTILDEKDFAAAQLKRLVEAGLAEETTAAKPKTEKATKRPAQKPPAKKEG